MRVFLDTNVLVSAFATRGMSADVLRLVLAEHTLVTSEVVLTELSGVLVSKIGVAQARAGEIEAFLREHEVVPRPAEASAIAIRDEDDWWVLASALAGNAEVLVTGDRGLLDIAGEVAIRVLDPRGFWEYARDSQAR